MKVAVFWFRRDLRLFDNVGLFHAFSSGLPVLPLFIFDQSIFHELAEDDPRVSFIHDQLSIIDKKLKEHASSLLIQSGKPLTIWTDLLEKFEVAQVFTNQDYEPYALERDRQVGELLKSKGVAFRTHKDQVIFEKNEIIKDDGNPYIVYTPYKKKWLLGVKEDSFESYGSEDLLNRAFKYQNYFPSIEEVGFRKSSIAVKPYNLETLNEYVEKRNFPSVDGGSYLSPHLRFGTVSVRKLSKLASRVSQTFLGELIWREFFMQILYHFPKVVKESFKSKYDNIQWENNEAQFKKWCDGETGYPMVDAGMRELNETGYMHNRVRMMVASFLTKHLLIDWRWGEAYFAEKLLDFELSSNNGNWQWAAGTGCDAAPYFRIFNPSEQLKKFDSKMIYIKKWLGDDLEKNLPIVDHKFARERALARYKKGLEN